MKKKRENNKILISRRTLPYFSQSQYVNANIKKYPADLSAVEIITNLSLCKCKTYRTFFDTAYSQGSSVNILGIYF